MKLSKTVSLKSKEQQIIIFGKLNIDNWTL